MASNFRRLAADHASLHNTGLPPHYFFPPASSSSSAISDTLTQLVVFLTGPQGTPYSQGLWRLQLRIPEDYPRNPPKASFKTRIWHPNVEETTGAVCVDTLKRDWDAKLTLRDVLITISCLLIHPNPDSALNSTAGALLQDDYDSFAHQAKLMTSIHASIPPELREAVIEAKRRGDETGTVITISEDEEGDEEKENSNQSTRGSLKKNDTSTIIMKNQPDAAAETARVGGSRVGGKLDIRIKQNHPKVSQRRRHQSHNEEEEEDEDEKEEEEEEEVGQENDPSISPSPVTIPPISPRKTVLGKRPLSVLATSETVDMVRVDYDDDDDDEYNGTEFEGMSASEKNIAANDNSESSHEQPQRKSPKLSELGRRSMNAPGRAATTKSSSARKQSSNDFGLSPFTKLANNNTNNHNNIHDDNDNKPEHTRHSDTPITSTATTISSTLPRISSTPDHPGEPSNFKQKQSESTNINNRNHNYNNNHKLNDTTAPSKPPQQSSSSSSSKDSTIILSKVPSSSSSTLTPRSTSTSTPSVRKPSGGGPSIRIKPRTGVRRL